MKIAHSTIECFLSRKRFFCSALILAILSFQKGALAQESISFPARSSDINPNSFWTVTEFSEGHAIMDLNVQRWDGNSWEGSSGSSNNAQNFDWNVPLYAPARGEIVSCWRNFPDYPTPILHSRPSNVFGGGNHVVIMTDQGNVISLNHLKSGSIPTNLCPPNDSDAQFPNTTAKQGDWRVAAYMEPADRPRVEEGDFIGRVGHNGNSGGPHLHISMHRVIGTDSYGREDIARPGQFQEDALPLRFRHAWGHAYNETQRTSANGWYRWRGGRFTNNGFKMIHPSPFLRRGEATAGTVRDTEVIFLSGNRAVSAMTDSANKLKLISWDIIGLETINRKRSTSAGSVKAIQMSEVASDTLLVAVQTQNDDLKLIAYRILFDGTFSRLAEYTAGKISSLSMTTLPGVNRKAVTAVRDSNGKLKLIVWDVNYTNNATASIERLGESSAGSISAVDVSHSRAFNGVFTAVRDNRNNLKVIPWKISSNGQTLTRGNSGSAGSVSTEIKVAPLGRGVAAAVRDTSGKLRLITWSASSEGNVESRRETHVAGSVSEINLLGTPHASSNLTTAIRDSSGKLQLIGWGINRNGTNLRRLGSSKTGSASKISTHGISRSYPGLDPRDMIISAMRDNNGNLKLVTWDTNLNNP